SNSLPWQVLGKICRSSPARPGIIRHRANHCERTIHISVIGIPKSPHQRIQGKTSMVHRGQYVPFNHSTTEAQPGENIGTSAKITRIRALASYNYAYNKRTAHHYYR